MYNLSSVLTSVPVLSHRQLANNSSFSELPRNSWDAAQNSMSVWEAVKTTVPIIPGRKSCWGKLGRVICLFPLLGGSSLLKESLPMASYSLFGQQENLWEGRDREGGCMVDYKQSQYTCLNESVMSHMSISVGMFAKM